MKTINSRITPANFVAFILLGVCTVMILFSQHASGLPQTPKTRVAVSDQPGSPIRILSTYIDSTNARQPIYGYSVTNLSDKAISAYAVMESVNLGSGPLVTSIVLTHLPSTSLLLQAHDSRQDDGGQGKTYAQIPVEVILTLDFVEFADGTRWGDDSGESRQKLEGKRAGGRSTIRRYREIFARSGMSGLERALAETELVPDESVKNNAAWLEGFKIGVNTVKHRLSSAKIKGGEEQTKRELDKPFDSTDGRSDP